MSEEKREATNLRGKKLLSGLVKLTRELNEETGFFHPNLILDQIPEEYDPLTRSINPLEIPLLLNP